MEEIITACITKNSKLKINIKKIKQNSKLPLKDEEDKNENRPKKILTWKNPNFIETVSIKSYKKYNFNSTHYNKSKRDSVCCNIF